MENAGKSPQLELTCRRESGGVTILRLRSSGGAVTVPDTLWGLPVTAIGDRAFAPGAADVEGETVRLLGDSGETDNRRITAVRLPDTIRHVGNYAFYNCTGLRTLSLSGETENWGGCALMNCRSLNTFHIRLSDPVSTVMAYFADELPGELDMTLQYPDGSVARLLFPDYQESYEENSPAHHFDYFIHGAGYPYHHVFRNKHLFLADFDGLWSAFLQTEHDDDCALRLAYYRLRYPREVSAEAEGAYLRYLRAHSGEALAWLVAEGDMEGLAWLLGRTEPPREALAQGCETARIRGRAEAVALLLEEQHRRFAPARTRCFDL